MKSFILTSLFLLSFPTFAIETTQIARCGDLVLEETIVGPQDGSTITQDEVFYQLKDVVRGGGIYTVRRSQYNEQVIYAFTMSNSPLSIAKTVVDGDLRFTMAGKKCLTTRIYSIYQ